MTSTNAHLLLSLHLITHSLPFRFLAHRVLNAAVTILMEVIQQGLHHLTSNTERSSLYPIGIQAPL
jgi:hypothetical protein